MRILLISVAALAGGAATYFTLVLEGGIAPLTSLASVFTEGLIAGIVGLATAALTLFVVENKEIRIMADAFDRLVRVPGDRSAALTPSAEEPVQP